MKLPGDAWLEWNIEPSGTILTQSAYFGPRGLAGRVYWFVMLPFHSLIFGRMARSIVETAQRRPEMDTPESIPR
jgi:Protein of unknown function (DUF2867)